MNNFSYEHYLQLIQRIKATIPLVDFASIRPEEQCFFILRHDVEFSVEKAYELAKLEHDKLGIQTSYFFQVRNYTYNPFAFKNLSLIKEIAAMGHKIGLHVNMTGVQQTQEVISLIKNDVLLLQNGLGLSVDRFSFHRPSHAILAANIKIEGLINTYDPLFFHYYDKNPPKELKIYYFSDSEHRWKYGDPLSILEKPIPKIQLLIHPYSWSVSGLDNLNNFQEIIKLKQTMLLQAMSEECHHFPNELLKK